MADASVIREFLVSLGFNVDLPGQTRFVDATIEATKAVLALAAGSIAAAGAVVLAISKMAEAGDELYYVSQRTKSSASNIQAFGFAAANMGSSVQAATASLEGLANWIRANPGAKGILQGLGINPNESTTDIMRDLGPRLAKMPVNLAQRYASMMGIDQNTLRAMMQGMSQFEEQYKRLLQSAGVNSDQAAAGAHNFMISLRSLGATLDVLGQAVAAKLYKGIGGDIDKFNALIQKNFGEITDWITKATKAIINFADEVIYVITRLAETFNDIVAWYDSLDKRQQTFLKASVFIIAAWKAINSAMMKGPLGAFMVLFAAFLFLLDDYEHYKKTGNSFFPWKEWIPEIDKIIKVLKRLFHAVDDIVKAVGGPNGWQYVFDAFAIFLAGSWIVKVLATLARVTGVLRVIRGLMALTGLLRGAGAAVGGAAAAGGVIADIAAAALPIAAAAVATGAIVATGVDMWKNGIIKSTANNDQPGGAVGNAQELPTGSGSNVNQMIAAGQQLGLPKSAIAAMVGNARGESNFNPHVQQKGGEGYGLFQWSYDRQAKFKQYMGKDIHNSTVADQMQFAVHEMKQNFPGLYKRMMSGELTPTQATQAFYKVFEAPAASDTSLGLRTMTANEIFNGMKEADGPPAPPKPPPSLPDSVNSVLSGLRNPVHAIAHPGHMVDRPSVPSRDMGAPMASNTTNAPVSQTNHITVNGAADPHATARVISTAQNRVNSDLIRNVASRAA